jgi:hypothetical protein
VTEKKKLVGRKICVVNQKKSVRLTLRRRRCAGRYAPKNKFSKQNPSPLFDVLETYISPFIGDIPPFIGEFD